MFVLFYFRVSVLLLAFSLAADMLSGATAEQALVVHGVRCGIRRQPLLLTLLLTLLLWPVGVAYSARVVLKLIPRKSFVELYEEGTN